jgi:hypothetical protein
MAVCWNYASDILLFHPLLVLELNRPPFCAGKGYILAVEEVFSPLPLAFIFGREKQAQLFQLVHFVNFGSWTSLALPFRAFAWFPLWLRSHGWATKWLCVVAALSLGIE